METYRSLEGEIIAAIGEKEVLAQLAEEAAELAQAALKMRRVLDGTNPTPTKGTDAWAALVEEYSDTLVCIEMLFSGTDHLESYQIRNRKIRRWLERIREAQEKGEVENG